jgi:hypothetical protein
VASKEKFMSSEERINKIIADLDRHVARNMGQKAIYLKTTVGIIQRRGDNNYMLYFFDHKDSLTGLDIRESNRFQNFTREELINFLNEELVDW